MSSGLHKQHRKAGTLDYNMWGEQLTAMLRAQKSQMLQNDSHRECDARGPRVPEVRRAPAPLQRTAELPSRACGSDVHASTYSPAPGRVAWLPHGSMASRGSVATLL